MERFGVVGYYEGRQINLQDPICISLPRSIIWPLCAHLSNEQAIMTDIGGDWRNLAEFIGLPPAIIQMIDDIRGRNSKAYTLLKLWDQKIPPNRGTLLKLIVALHNAGFAKSYLKELIITPLKDSINFQVIMDYVQSLQQEEIREMFPILNVQDIEWDDELESDVILPVDPKTKDDSVDDVIPKPRIIKDSIFISYFSNSSSKNYKRGIENLARTFKHRGHTVWYDKPGLGLTPQQKENYIKSADNILVVYNKEYQREYHNFTHRLEISPCVATDIQLLSYMFNNVIGAKRRIIPVIIDHCRSQPTLSDLPLFLTGVSRFLYPSQQTELLHTVQGVLEYDIPPVKPIKHVIPKKINKAEIRKRFPPRQ